MILGCGEIRSDVIVGSSRAYTKYLLNALSLASLSLLGVAIPLITFQIVL